MKSNEKLLLQQLATILNATSIYNRKKISQLSELNAPEIQHHINALLRILGTKHKRELLSLKPAQGVKKTMKNLNNQPKMSDLPVIEISLRLPNVRANLSTECTITPDMVKGKKLSWHTHAVELAGVNIDTNSQKITFNCTEAKDHQFSIIALEPLKSGIYQRVRLNIKVTVVPDPKTLWKDIPSDNSLRFHKPDTDQKAAENQDFITFASSVRGRSHAHQGTHRDDDVSIVCDKVSGWSISCVADGAGSCAYSRHGAYLASKHAANTLKEALRGPYGEHLEKILSNHAENHSINGESLQNTIVKSVYQAYKHITEAVDQSHGDTIKDFSTTLLLSAVKKVSDGYLFVSFSIGDGAVVVLGDTMQPTLLSRPDTGLYAGQTRFLDAKLFEGHEVYERISVEKLKNFSALILATDGITDAWFKTDAMLSDQSAWQILWNELQDKVSYPAPDGALEALTKWMDFWSPGNHDDRTLSITLPKE